MRFPPLDESVDILQVADLLGDDNYLGVVVGYLNIPIQWLDSSHHKEEVKKALRHRPRLK